MSEEIELNYRSSRLTKGNLFFPDRLVVYDDGIEFRKRGIIGGDEERIPFRQIASVSVRKGMLFADLMFETTGGTAPASLNGLWIGEAERAKADLEMRMREHGVGGDAQVIALLQEQNRILNRLVSILVDRQLKGLPVVVDAPEEEATE